MIRISTLNLSSAFRRVTNYIVEYIRFLVKEIAYITNYFKIMLFKLAIFVASLAIILSSTEISVYIVLPSLFFVYQLLGGWQLTKLFYNTFFRDMKLVILKI